MRVAVLGMGRMGRAVAGRLAGAGHEVTVWNRTPGRAGEIVALGGREAASPSEAARGAEVVATSLADDSALLGVLEEGPGSLAGALGATTVLLEMSTVSPETTRSVAARIAGGLVASPILGAPQAVAAGEAVYLAAGPAGALERVAPLFEALGGRVRVLGEDPGRALEIKVLANYLLLGGLAVLAEAVAAGEAAGIPTEELRAFLSGSPLVAPALSNRLGALLSHDHSGWFSTTLGAKDAGLAVALAGRHGLELPIAEVVRRRYDVAAESGWAEADLTAVIEPLTVDRPADQ